MAFRELPKPERGPGNINPNVTAVAYSNGKHAQTVIGIPREILRASGIPDLPGERVNVLVGEGDDSGKIAIVPGDSFVLAKVGSGKNRLMISSSRIADGVRKMVNCTVETGRKQLIISLPGGFLDAEAPQQPLTIAA